MKLFQRLINLLKQFKLTQIKYHLNGKAIDLTGDNITISSTNFSVDKNGNISCKNAKITGGTIAITDTSSEGSGNNITMKNANDSNIKASIGSSGYDFETSNLRSYLFNGPSQINQHMRNSSASTAISSQVGGSESTTMLYVRSGNNYSYVKPSNIQSKEFINSSLESMKKNFEKLENGLDIVKATEIYKYNFKSQEDTDKKHIGFVIGDNYKYSKDITSSNDEGADTYSMVSVAYKAIQEQQELIEQLQNEIKELKGEK